MDLADVVVSLIGRNIRRFARKVHLLMGQGKQSLWLVPQNGDRLLLRLQSRSGRWELASHSAFIEEHRWITPLLGAQFPLSPRMGGLPWLTVGPAIFDSFQPVFDLEFPLLTLGGQQIFGNNALSFLLNVLPQRLTRMSHGFFTGIRR